MKAILKFTLIGLLAVVVAGITVAGVAYAQGDGPDGREGLAEILGLTREELRDQLQDGKTLEELAEAAGVDLEAYREEIRQTKQVDLETRIEEALDNGDITQDHADWLLEGLDKGFLDNPFGFGGRGSSGRPDMDGAGIPRMRGGKPSSGQ
jgi:hypothetical protein